LLQTNYIWLLKTKKQTQNIQIYIITKLLPFVKRLFFVSEDYKSVGCYRDTGNRAIPTIEGKDPILDGPYRSRKNAIAKCAIAARRKGFYMFALQHGGWCASSATAEKTFDKYGKSRDCQDDGEGGPWANNVYTFQGWQK